MINRTNKKTCFSGEIFVLKPEKVFFQTLATKLQLEQKKEENSREREGMIFM